MPLPYNQRTCYCGQIGEQHVGQSVLLAGWVHRRRDHGGMVFVDLRDREGAVQLRFDPETDPKAHEAARKLHPEACIAVRGEVVRRPEGLVNPKMKTGTVEVAVREIDLLSDSDPPVFEIEDAIDVGEETRLRYRYLDLRRPRMQQALIRRHRICKIIRDYFDAHGFVEIETPFLTKSTPEGARDYLVPSRIYPGHFYALPQSPQIFKQLLMISGFDRYMQIVRCFRDEDLRADRQPEFTQLDLEMSFVQPDDVLTLVEGCMARLMKEIVGVEVPTPFARMSYDEAMRRYGIDRPDTRYDLHIEDVSDIVRTLEFRVFRQPLDAGGCVRCIVVPGGAEMTRRELDALTDDLRGIGAGGLPYAKIAEGGRLETGVAKFFDAGATQALLERTGAATGDLILFAADSEANVCKYLAWLRETVARRRGLIPQDRWNFVWIVDFPMFEYHEEDGRFYAMHHPFTAPRDEDIELLTPQDAGRCRAKAYDLVLNGIELGGGSIRIHRADVQQKVFELLKIGPDEQRAKFGFLLDALRYGPPPHGGIALGLDRIVMMLSGLDNIRDVIGFPKTQRAVCPLTGAPSEVSQQQLDELHLRIVPPTK